MELLWSLYFLKGYLSVPLSTLLNLLPSPPSLKGVSPGPTALCRTAQFLQVIDKPDIDREGQLIHPELVEDIKVNHTCWCVYIYTLQSHLAKIQL